MNRSMYDEETSTYNNTQVAKRAHADFVAMPVFDRVKQQFLSRDSKTLSSTTALEPATYSFAGGEQPPIRDIPLGSTLWEGPPQSLVKKEELERKAECRRGRWQGAHHYYSKEKDMSTTNESTAYGSYLQQAEHVGLFRKLQSMNLCCDLPRQIATEGPRGPLRRFCDLPRKTATEGPRGQSRSFSSSDDDSEDGKLLRETRRRQRNADNDDEKASSRRRRRLGQSSNQQNDTESEEVECKGDEDICVKIARDWNCFIRLLRECLPLARPQRLVDTCRQARVSSNPIEDFPWPVNEMAEYEYGSENSFGLVNFDNILVIANLPIHPGSKRLCSRTNVKHMISSLFFTGLASPLDIKIPCDESTQEIKGCAFVEFSSKEDVVTVAERCDGIRWSSHAAEIRMRPFRAYSAVLINHRSRSPSEGSPAYGVVEAETNPRQLENMPKCKNVSLDANVVTDDSDLDILTAHQITRATLADDETMDLSFESASIASLLEDSGEMHLPREGRRQETKGGERSTRSSSAEESRTQRRHAEDAILTQLSAERQKESALLEEAGKAHAYIEHLLVDTQRLSEELEQAEKGNCKLLLENMLLRTKLVAERAKNARLEHSLASQELSTSLAPLYRTQISTDGDNRNSRSETLEKSNDGIGKALQFAQALETSLTECLGTNVSSQAVIAGDLHYLKELEGKLTSMNAFVRQLKEERLNMERKSVYQQYNVEKGRRLCIICSDMTRSTLLLPCRHLCVCQTCSAHPELRKCPLCRQEISQKIEVYVS